MRRVLAVASAGLLFLTACGSDDDESSETTTTEADPTVEEALAKFCEEGDIYIDALDTYGQVFDETGPTVGDLRAGAEPLVEAGEAANAAGEDLKEAVELQDEKLAEETAAAEAAGEEPPTTLVTVEVSDDLIAQVDAAEANFQTAIDGVDDSTGLAEADVAITSSAYELEVTWAALLLEAGCVEDENAALEQVRQYVAAIQTDLTTAGYFTGTIDGIWGTDTVDAVKALQAANGLPETGFLDPISQQALAEALAGQESAQISALQGVLTAAGFYTGPIDGQWSEELENSLKAFQEALGLEPTGQIDGATLRAFQDRLAAGEAALNATTTVPETTQAPETTLPPETTTTAAPAGG